MAVSTMLRCESSRKKKERRSRWEEKRMRHRFTENSIIGDGQTTYTESHRGPWGTSNSHANKPIYLASHSFELLG